MSSVVPASRRRHRFVSSALFLILGLHVGAWAVQLGALAAALRLEPAALGTALSAGAAGGIATLVLGGRAADRFGRRAVLLTGFGVTGLAFAGLAAAQDLLQVVVAVVVYGLSISLVDLGANAVGSDFERAHGVEAMTGLQAGFSLGAVLGAASTAVLLAVGVDYRLVYAGLGVVFLGTAAAAGRVGLPVPPAAPAGEGASVPAVRLWRRPGVLLATAVVLVCFFGDGALEGFLAVFLRDALDSGVLVSGLGVAGFHAASFAGRTVASRALRRVQTGVVITAAGLLAAVGATTGVLAPTVGLSIAGMLLVGFAVSPVVPGALSLAGRSAPDRAGRAVAFTTAVGYASFLVSPLVVGGIASAAGLRAGLGVVVITSLGLAVLGSRWPRPGGRPAA